MIGYRTAFAMFKAQETDDMEAADELWRGFEGPDAELVLGMTLVAAVLRKHLLDHAERLGCNCGSDDWLAGRLVAAHLLEEGDAHA